MTILELGLKFRKLFGFNPPIDIYLTAAKGPNNACIDVLKLDDELSKRDSEYDNKKCTYKSKPDYSMSKYIKEKYGTEAHDLVKFNL